MINNTRTRCPCEQCKPFPERWVATDPLEGARLAPLVQSLKGSATRWCKQRLAHHAYFGAIWTLKSYGNGVRGNVGGRVWCTGRAAPDGPLPVGAIHHSFPEELSLTTKTRNAPGLEADLYENSGEFWTSRQFVPSPCKDHSTASVKRGHEWGALTHPLLIGVWNLGF